MMEREDIEMMRERYTPGTEIVLHEMSGEPRMRDGLKGTVTGVDDAGQIHVRWENGSSLALNAEEDRFEVTAPEDKLEVLIVEPGKYPRAAVIDDTLEAMQSIVEGYIDQYSPFEDEVSIVCNDEGKMAGLPLNRAVYDEVTGDMIDIIAGNFFLVASPADSESFKSLSPEMQLKYGKMFRYPERFTERYGIISVEKYKPVPKDRER